MRRYPLLLLILLSVGSVMSGCSRNTSSSATDGRTKAVPPNEARSVSTTESAAMSAAQQEERPAAGPRITKALTNPSSVSSYYLHPHRGYEGFEDGERPPIIAGWMGDYMIIAGGKRPDHVGAVVIGNLLLEGSSYSTDPVKPCAFSPRHGLVYMTAAPETVRVYVWICFECAQLKIATSDGQERWGGDFDPIAAKLQLRVEELLPKWANIDE